MAADAWPEGEQRILTVAVGPDMKPQSNYVELAEQSDRDWEWRSGFRGRVSIHYRRRASMRVECFGYGSPGD